MCVPVNNIEGNAAHRVDPEPKLQIVAEDEAHVGDGLAGNPVGIGTDHAHSCIRKEDQVDRAIKPEVPGRGGSGGG
jgi:hypothetical protein